MIKGAYNLRDLGGNRSIDGRIVRTGLLFRSGSPAHFSPAAVDAALKLNLSFIVDLRSDPERLHGPTPALLDAIPQWRLASDNLGDPRPLLDRCLGGTSGIDAMRDIYRTMPFAQADAYRALFSHILKGRTPLLFHCAAGKDRTGVASALLLALLGVGRDEIMADFVRSNDDREQMRASFLAYAGHEFASSEALWSPILDADPTYIDTMFDEITRQYGDIIGYAKAVLHLSEENITALGDTLLE